MIRPLSFFLALLLSLAALSSAQAQVLIYKLDFRKDKGINYHPFTGGYFIAPLLGGSGTFLLTSTEDERVYMEASDGGRLFTAISGGGDKKAVISASLGAGTAMGALVALGDINHTVHVRGPTYTLDARVAKSLTGMSVSADDESEAEGPALNGSIGAAGFSEIKINLDEEETNRANYKGQSLSQASEAIRLMLERQGFHNADGDDDDGDDDGEEETTVTE